MAHFFIPFLSISVLCNIIPKKFLSFYTDYMFLFSCHSFSENSLQIINYKNSWAYTQDLANSIHTRGEISNHCIEVGIEYLQMTNKRETKFIMGLQVTSFLLKEEFQKQVGVHTFKRRKYFSLSVMKQVRIFFP